MPELFLAALGLVLLILLLQKLEHAETKFLVQTLKWTLIGLMVVACIYLTLVGRLLYVAAITVLLILLLKKDINIWMQKKNYSLSLPRRLTEKEAAALLKIDLNASAEEIQAAYMKIKIKDSTHQDLLLRARDLLLKKANFKKRTTKKS